MTPTSDRTSRRLAGTGAAALALWALVVLRLVQVQVVQRGAWVRAAERQQERSIEVAGERGAILDREGRALAVSVPAASAFVDPSRIAPGGDEAQAARKLATVLDRSEHDIRKQLSRDAEFAWLERRLPLDRRDALDRLAVPGVAFVPESRRAYPQGELLSHVL